MSTPVEGVWESGDRTESAQKRKILYNFYDENGKDSDDQDNCWAYCNNMGMYRILTIHGDPLHKTESLATQRKPEHTLCNEQTFSEYVSYLQTGSELSYRRAQSGIKTGKIY